LEHELATLSVECLPANIPNSLEVDISSLTEPEQTIRIKDVAVDKDVAILNNPELVVAKISVRHVEKVEEEVAEVAEEAAEAAQEAAPGEKQPEET